MFVHGNPGSGEDWQGSDARDRRVRPRGRARHARVRPRRQAARLPVHLAGYAEFLDGLLEELGIDRVHLVVHDLGGPWGLEWAARNPYRVASVVLINTGALIGYRWHILARIWRTPVLGEVFQGTATRPAVPAADEPRPEAQAVARASSNHMYDANFTRPTRRAVLKRIPERFPDPAGDGAARRRRCARTTFPRWSCGARATPTSGIELAEAQQEAFPSAQILRARRLRPLALRRRPRRRTRDTVVPVPARARQLVPRERRPFMTTATANRQIRLRQRPDGRIDEQHVRDGRGGDARAAGRARRWCRTSTCRSTPRTAPGSARSRPTCRRSGSAR